MALAPSMLTWTSGGALASSFHGALRRPSLYGQSRNPLTRLRIDLSNTRSSSLNRLIKDIRQRVGKQYQASRKKLAEWESVVDELLLHPLWQLVGECRAFPNSMVMYERHGYCDYLQGLMFLDLGLLVNSDFGVIDRVTGDLKPIWDLYEMWCYFQLRAILEKITGCPGEPTKEQLIRSKDF